MRLYATLPPKPTEAEAELLAFERAEQVAEFHALCEHALAELITTGTSLAKAVATRLEFDVARDIADRYGSAGFKGGQLAGKAFALASQSVRQSVLLLRKALQPEWWTTLERESDGGRRRGPADVVADAPAGAEAGAEGVGAAPRKPDGESREGLERVDRLERIERLERVEDFISAVAPDRMIGAAEALRPDVAAASAGKTWPGAAEAVLAEDDPPGPRHAGRDGPDPPD